MEQENSATLITQFSLPEVNAINQRDIGFVDLCHELIGPKNSSLFSLAIEKNKFAVCATWEEIASYCKLHTVLTGCFYTEIKTFTYLKSER